MSIPLLASVNPASTLPFAGQIQSMSSPSGTAGFGASTGGGGGAGISASGGGGAGAAPSGAPNCAIALSEYGTFWPRGSTFALAVLASGRASIGGPDKASGVVTLPAAGPALPGAPSTRTRPTLITLRLVMLFHAASSR